VRLLTASAALLVSIILTGTVVLADEDTDKERVPVTLVFTAIPDQNESQLMERFGKVAVYLEEQLHVPVKYIPVKNYPAAIIAFRNNQVQLAWFGGLSGVQARAIVPNSQAIAQGYEDQSFKSYFIAHKSAGISSSETFPKDIAGKTFVFGSKGSTSGRLMPEYFIRQSFEKAPGKVFSRVGFSGDHSRTLALVSSGVFQVGALNYTVWDEALKNGTVNTDDVKVIWTTPNYPDYQWSVRGDADELFGEGFIEKLKQVLLSIDDKNLLAAFPRSAFVPADNSLYQPIESAAKALGIMADF